MPPEIFLPLIFLPDWSLERALRALVENDPAVASEVMQAKNEINHLAAQAEDHLSRRLAANEPKRLVAFRLESEIMEYLKRVYYFAKRIAKVVGEEDLAYRTPRQSPTMEEPAAHLLKS